MKKTLYKYNKHTGRFTECNGTRIHSNYFRVELDSDGETDFVRYYKGDTLQFIEVIDWKVGEDNEV